MKRRRLPTLILLLAFPAVVLVSGSLAGRATHTITITSGPSGTTASTDAAFTFVSSASATFTCSLDGGAERGCGSGRQGSASYSSLGVGSHRFSVIATVSSRDTARADRSWSISGPPPPPPPPPPPAPAPVHLVVAVGSGGSVASAPAGISCSPTCAASYASGTAVTLTARAIEGFVFTGWGGACAGPGPCTLRLTDLTYVAARFARSSTAPALFRGDRDGDGVLDAADRCPATSPRAKIVRFGCSLPDLVHGDGVLLQAVARAAARAGAKLRPIKGLSPVVGVLNRQVGILGTGVGLLEHGDPCGAEATAMRAGRAIGIAVRKGTTLIGTLEAAVVKEPFPVGDAGEKDVKWASLHYRQGVLEAVNGAAGDLAKVLGASCRALGKKVVLVGRVKKIDDAAGWLRLENGIAVLLPGAKKRDGSLWEGVRVHVVARRTERGPWIGEAVVAQQKPQSETLKHVPCIRLVIAPVQDFDKANPVLHDPRGYLFNGRLWLEGGTRVAASHVCASAKPKYRYSLSIEATSPGSSTIAVAADLTASDGPVPLLIPPSGSTSAKVWDLTVTERRQGSNCAPGGTKPASSSNDATAQPSTSAKGFPCPVVIFGSTSYTLRMRPAAFYGKAQYESTTFDLESKGFGTGTVVGLAGLHATIPQATFEASGFAIQGTQSAGFLSTIQQNQKFAVWPEAWYGFPLLFPMDTVGVDHYAALVWPRIVGKRNGHPFRYRAALPNIVTDLLPDCPAKNCFYRYPWRGGLVVRLAQGNNSPGSKASHCCPPQNFAFDFSMEDKSSIYATRGGIVGDVVESNKLNFNPCDPKTPNADGPSNFIRVDHQDGTYSYYAHVDTNTVQPEIGDAVTRGAVLAKVDNIGRSCGTHLHYQVSIDSTNTIYGQTTQICFEGWGLHPLPLPPVFLGFSKCYTPVTDDYLLSTNQ